MLGWHQAVDFQEERILWHLLLKGRYLGQRYVPLPRHDAKKALNSQGHLAGLCCGQACPFGL